MRLNQGAASFEVQGQGRGSWWCIDQTISFNDALFSLRGRGGARLRRPRPSKGLSPWAETQLWSDLGVSSTTLQVVICTGHYLIQWNVMQHFNSSFTLVLCEVLKNNGKWVGAEEFQKSLSTRTHWNLVLRCSQTSSLCCIFFFLANQVQAPK